MKQVKLVLFLAFLLSCTPRPGGGYWPAGAWRTSTPQAQGMDGAALAALDAEFASGKHGQIDGMLVIRHGHVVHDRTYTNDYDRLFVGYDPVRGMYNYYDPDWHPWHQRSDLHTLQSVTKSVTSAAIGIAIGRGEIPGVEVTILRYFEGAPVANLDDRKRSITLRDLLTMTAGLRWNEDLVPYTDPTNTCNIMEMSPDWVRFVIDQPMEADPGRTFRYSSGVSELLAHILLKATGRQVDEYVAEHLFRPLGIERSYWKHTPTGLPDTEGGLYLARADLAKFGYLYMHDGVWAGARVLPQGWVAETMRPRADPGAGHPSGVRYGYQWWLLPHGEAGTFAYTGWGFGGQFLFVVPELDLVAVFNGWNIYSHPELDPKVALDRVLGAVVTGPRAD
jgi:CubicO group peptidase (beta-lactamase class C family)